MKSQNSSIFPKTFCAQCMLDNKLFKEDFLQEIYKNAFLPKTLKFDIFEILTSKVHAKKYKQSLPNFS